MRADLNDPGSARYALSRPHRGRGLGSGKLGHHMSDQIGEVPEAEEAGMRPRERRSRIVDLVAARGSVRIEDLARDLGVSVMTIHRDLDELGKAQLLRKVRGAATALPSALFESGVPVRLARQQREKVALARAALQHVEPGQAIMLDDSTTGIYLARLLSARTPATVITNFLAVMRELTDKPEIRLIGLGGAYFEWADAFMGSMTIDAIESLRADVVVMSTSAITDGVCYHQSQDTVMFKKAMLGAAALRILCVDHTKFVRRALHALAPLTSFDLVLVDDQTPFETLEQMRSSGVSLEVVSLSPSRAPDGRSSDADQPPLSAPED